MLRELQFNSSRFVRFPLFKYNNNYVSVCGVVNNLDNTRMQIGNEINDGLLWPTGQISVNGFTGVSRLLHAGALAVRTASPSTKNVIHLANGWDQASISWFYTGIFNKSETGEGLGCGLTHSDVDVMGFSFYPFYGTSATLSNLRSSMDYVVSTYDKVRGIQITGWMTRSYKHLQDIMIVETDWPVVCNTEATPLSEPTIPVNTEGQIIWVEDISAVLNNMNIDCGDKALGIVYWEPGWIGNAALGSACAVRSFLPLKPCKLSDHLFMSGP